MIMSVLESVYNVSIKLHLILNLDGKCSMKQWSQWSLLVTIKQNYYHVSL